MIIVMIIKIIRRRRRFIYQTKTPFQTHTPYWFEETVKFWKEPVSLLLFCSFLSLSFSIGFLSPNAAGARNSLGKSKTKQNYPGKTGG